jgi:hypothetical protein
MDIANLLENCQKLDRSKLEKLLATPAGIQGTFAPKFLLEPLPVYGLILLCEILSRRYPKLPWTLIKAILMTLGSSLFPVVTLLNDATVRRQAQTSVGSEADASSRDKGESAKTDRN